MATQAEQLSENITKLTKAIHDLKKTSLVPPVNPLEDMIDKPDFFMTHRQVAKKIMLTTCGTVPGLVGESSIPKIDEETAHLAIYGKLMKDSDGKLIDDENKFPECVDWILFKKSPDSDEDIFPMKDTIKKMKDEAKEAIKGLFTKITELGAEASKAGVEIGVGSAAFIDAATNIPKPQPALAISAVLGILSSVSKLQSKVLEIVPYLAPLLNLTVLLPITILDTVLGIINTGLVTCIGLMTTITSVTKPVSAIKKLIPAIPSNPMDGLPEGFKSAVSQSLSGTINGVVYDIITGVRVGGASVQVNTMNPVLTDNTGFFTVNKVDKGSTDPTEIGVATITVSANNYKTVTVNSQVQSGKTIETNIGLTKN
jgi:hypothetical protein